MHPPGIVDWGTTPRDFLEGRAGMIWTTTGPLSNIRTNAKFPFGVGMLPAGVQRGSPTGGGNFHLFKSANPAQRQAALQFLRWVTSPARTAQWCIDTGYVATHDNQRVIQSFDDELQAALTGTKQPGAALADAQAAATRLLRPYRT